MTEAFPERFKNLRNKQGITQAEMAEILHVSRSCIANYEKGDRHPDLEGVVRIADYFQVSMDYLLGHIVPRKQTAEIRWTENAAKKQATIDINPFTAKEKIAILSFYRYLTEPIG